MKQFVRLFGPTKDNGEGLLEIFPQPFLGPKLLPIKNEIMNNKTISKIKIRENK